MCTDAELCTVGYASRTELQAAMMRAIMVKQFGSADVMQLGEVELPEPGRDEVLVRVLAAGVGPWDVELRSGGRSGPLPYIPGAEFAGLVVGETGATAGLGDGSLVYGWPGPVGCYAEYVTCHVERLAPIPAGLRVTEAAAVPVDALTADQGVTILGVGARDTVLITAGAGGLGHFAVQMARALGAVVIATADPRDHEFVHKLGAAVVVDQTAPGWPDRVRDVTGGGAERVLACAASSLSGAARAARDGAAIATPVRAALPKADWIRWRPYEGRPNGSRLTQMTPRFDDGSLSVQTSAMYYWEDAAQAHRTVERGDIPGEVVLVIDDDLAATLEI
jgi:NADPH:quinone reductase-like Zn-dependent oxidoreductase